MKKKIYISWLVSMAICLVFSCLFSARAIAAGKNDALHWYLKNNDTHDQPSIDPAQSRIEKYNGYYVDKRCGKTSEDKVLYLTFDAGYENGNVAKILDVLKEEQVPAAFFVLKNIVLKQEVLLKRMVKEGHTVCNHTMSHRDTTKMNETEFKQELLGLAELYKDVIGEEMPCYYRPPEGCFNEKTLQWASDMGYKTVFWSFAYVDWDNERQPDPEKAKEKIKKHTHNGAVILLHPTSETNAKILSDVIRDWKAQGYRFGTLDELCGQ